MVKPRHLIGKHVNQMEWELKTNCRLMLVDALLHFSYVPSMLVNSLNILAHGPFSFLTIAQVYPTTFEWPRSGLSKRTIEKAMLELTLEKGVNRSGRQFTGFRESQN